MEHCYSTMLVIYYITFMHMSALGYNNWVKCPTDCSRVRCHRYKTLKKHCKAGTVYGQCGCCQICAKSNGETCRGLQEVHGKCGAGLYCYPPDRHHHEIGICTYTPKHPAPRDFALRTQNSVEVLCKPKCIPEFCSKWPDAICSAIDNAIITRNCQQPCQHTICQACYFKTRREPPCPKCAHDDFNCMKKFSKCVKRDTCTRHKFPCEPHQKKKSDGRFVCKVPACLV